jgi:hypothetical protein
MEKPKRKRSGGVGTMPIVEPEVGSGPMSHDDIARRAYELYEARGREHGHDLDDWLQAERDCRSTVRVSIAM